MLLSSLFIKKALRLNNLQTRTSLNAKISVLVIYVEAITYLLLCNLHDCTLKTKRNRRWKIPQTVLKRRTLCFSPYNNQKLKVKLWWVEAFFYRLFWPKWQWKFLNICVLAQCVAQCIVYWMYFLNIHTFTYKKHCFIHFCCLFLKSVITQTR